jgi:xanthine dehydrogenase accessory factor
MANLIAAATAFIQQGIPCALIEVTHTAGSVPRERGTQMLVTATATVGTIGGGHLEYQAIAQARLQLSSKNSAAVALHFALGPSLGQCCGGSVDLQIQLLTPAMLATLLPPKARFHLQLYGAGHVGQALIRALAPIDCTIDWIDERQEFEAAAVSLSAQPQQVAKVTCMAVDAVASEVAAAAPNALYLVMTHSHDLDLAIVQNVLARGDFLYLGLIGSKTKRARFESQLRKRDFTDVQLNRITCPIGVSGINDKAPEIIAAAAVAQLLQYAKLHA